MPLFVSGAGNQVAKEKVIGTETQVDEPSQEDKINHIIGLLAESIRADWSTPVGGRLEVISELAGYLDAAEALHYRKWIRKHESDVQEDGRCMRDGWPGPYGGHRVPLSHLAEFDVSPDIFYPYQDHYVE